MDHMSIYFTIELYNISENSFSGEYFVTYSNRTCVILYGCNYVNICGYKLVQIHNSFKARK